MAQNRARTALLLVLLAILGWTNNLAAQADEFGCTDVWACNFNPTATEDDGSCDYQSCIGCTNQYSQRLPAMIDGLAVCGPCARAQSKVEQRN